MEAGGDRGKGAAPTTARVRPPVPPERGQHGRETLLSVIEGPMINRNEESFAKKNIGIKSVPIKIEGLGTWL
jgi:hypothetical protein